ncbi:MAG: glycosyltransferase family 2 protein [Candidatus Kapabacteria bacterium]|nr:glycosyltransferase family 2 protein [Candidatus Kapabacteria bacterium]
MNQSVAAVIITFNRLELLKEVLSAVKNQSRKPDKIIVVNNSSTDGTTEWLSEQEGIDVITQDNLGSSGGQYTGLKITYESGFDWIWTMDDDVVPETNCLENLLKANGNYLIRTPLRFDSKNIPFLNDAVSYNFSNPFKSLWVRIISKEDLSNDYIEAVGITFEGPLIHRSVIEKIGLPNPNFFIFADDTDFFVRANRANFKSAIVTSAKLYRKIDIPKDIYKFTWKTYYIVRNLIWLDRIFGSFLVKYIRPFGYLLVWLLRSKSFSDIITVFKAFKSGYLGKYR